jgi:hypothetical protein
LGWLEDEADGSTWLCSLDEEADDSGSVGWLEDGGGTM